MEVADAWPWASLLLDLLLDNGMAAPYAGRHHPRCWGEAHAFGPSRTKSAMAKGFSALRISHRRLKHVNQLSAMVKGFSALRILPRRLEHVNQLSAMANGFLALRILPHHLERGLTPR